MTQVTAAGTVVVASAGNSAGHAVGSPANCPSVIAVAGLRHVGTKVGFSDLGAGISIAAPGGNCINITTGSPCLYPIMTTSNAGTTTPVASGIYTDSFNASLGTSFSAPLVAGTAALMLSLQPTLTPAEVKTKLQSSARPFPTTGGSAGTPVCSAPTGADQLECYCPNPERSHDLCGAGMLDAHAAVLVGRRAGADLGDDGDADRRPGRPARLDLARRQRAVDRQLPVDDHQRRHHRRDDFGHGQRRDRDGRTDGGRHVHDPADDDRWQRHRVDREPVGDGRCRGGHATRLVADDDAVLDDADVDELGGGGALGAGWLVLLLVAIAALARAGGAPLRASRRG